MVWNLLINVAKYFTHLQQWGNLNEEIYINTNRINPKILASNCKCLEC